MRDAAELPAPGPRTRLRRRPDRGRYDAASLHAVLDSALLAHVGFQVDGQPFVTPTTFWREGERLYFHGAAASRMLEATTAGVPICLTVSHLDGLVLARSGFVHSVCYRSAMVFGTARRIEGLAKKRAAMDAFLERLYPGRTRELRPSSEQELAQIILAEMTIEEASVKVREGGPKDYPPDAGWPAWCGVIPVAQRLGAAEGEGDPGLALYPAGARLDAALAAAAHSGLPVST